MIAELFKLPRRGVLVVVAAVLLVIMWAMLNHRDSYEDSDTDSDASDSAEWDPEDDLNWDLDGDDPRATAVNTTLKDAPDSENEISDLADGTRRERRKERRARRRDMRLQRNDRRGGGGGNGGGKSLGGNGGRSGGRGGGGGACPAGYTSGQMTFYSGNEPELGYGTGTVGSHDNKLVAGKSVATPNARDYGRKVDIRGYGIVTVDDECRGGGCKEFDMYMGDRVRSSDLNRKGVENICYKWM